MLNLSNVIESRTAEELKIERNESHVRNEKDPFRRIFWRGKSVVGHQVRTALECVGALDEDGRLQESG